MNQQIRVRRSGLITFAIKIASTLTGFAFVVLVTSHLTVPDFALWQLMSRALSYVIFPMTILNFWTTRYRARGTVLGKTIVLTSAAFAIVMTGAYILLAYWLAGSSGIGVGYSSNLHFFFLSIPQISLTYIAGVLEAVLWGVTPEKASFGFGMFEISKVIIGAGTVYYLHLSLTGAILAVIGAEIVQLCTTAYLSRDEFTDKISMFLISKMLRASWVAVLNQITPLVISFDLLFVTLITQSSDTIAFYTAAFTYGSIIAYSNWIAYGLYAGILAGIDPRKSANQVLELQYLFTIPMVIGEIVLAYPLLHLFKLDYTAAVPILFISAIACALNAFSMTFDNIITGTDTTDAANKAEFSLYLKSKLFIVSRINLVISFAYLVAVSVFSELFKSQTSNLLGLSQPVFIGCLWALSALGMWTAAVLLKLGYVRKITSLSVAPREGISLTVGAIGYTVVMYLLSRVIAIHGGEITQALLILLIGAVSLSTYAGIILTISSSMRVLLRHAFVSLTGRES